MNEFAAAAFRFGHSLLKPQFAQASNFNSTLIQAHLHERRQLIRPAEKERKILAVSLFF
jgi:hypothetical protein